MKLKEYCLLAICILAMPSVNAFSQKETPFIVFQNVWHEYKKDNVEITLLTPVPAEAIVQIAPTLQKSLKIKKDVVYNYESKNTVGGILTNLLRVKYGKKSNEKNDFFAIQYSTNSEDFKNYLQKWPNSKFKEEATARLTCFKENELWETANSKKTRKDYETFAKYCANNPLCDYEGCGSISKSNHEIGEAVNAWYALSDRSKGNNYAIYKDYNKYMEKYGKYSPFAKMANDSMLINLERYDWNDAKSKNTSAAYKKYINSHKNGQHIKEAQVLIEELELWEKAVASKDYNNYNNYYSKYPDGKFSKQAIGFMKQYEEPFYKAAWGKNTIEAYEEFVEKFPSGAYSNDANNKLIELKKGLFKDPPSFSSLALVGKYSHPGYSLVCLGNIDRSTTITISMAGPTGFSKKIKPGNWEWVRVKNGFYKILVEATKVQNWWGSATFENHMYTDAWATTTTFNGIKIGSNKDDSALERMVKEVQEKALEEEINALMYIYGIQDKDKDE